MMPNDSETNSVHIGPKAPELLKNAPAVSVLCCDNVGVAFSRTAASAHAHVCQPMHKCAPMSACCAARVAETDRTAAVPQPMKTKSIIVQNSAHACWICQRMPYSMQLKMQPAPYNTRYALQHTHHTALVQPAACIIVHSSAWLHLRQTTCRVRCTASCRCGSGMMWTWRVRSAHSR